MRFGWRFFRIKRMPVLACLFIASLLVGAFQPRAEPASSSRISPVVMGNTGLPRVALMFNVDWGEEHIPAILEILDEQGVKATYFVTGSWARKNPDLLRQIAAAGHEIGNHGFFHGHPAKMSLSENEALIKDNESLLKEILGQEPPRIYAPPYGEYSDETLQAAAALGYKTILWTVDTVDWKRPPPETIRKRVAKAGNGCLLLMHPTEPTKLALPGIIEDLRDRGLTPTTVSQALEGS